LANEHSYFDTHSNYFWQWEENGTVIAIPGGATIAYKQHFGEIIGHLHTQGLPPLGSLLLALIATNPGGREALNHVDTLVASLQSPKTAIVTEAMEFLRMLSDIPASFKQGKRRLYLLQVLFDRCHHILSLKGSAYVYQHYQQGMPGEPAQNKPAGTWLLERDFRTLALLKHRFKSVDDIIDRITGLPDPQQIQIQFEEAPTAPDAPTPATDFVGELIQHNKTFVVGSLVRWLWSGLNIPVHSALPSQQPLGGVSDLTNKGSYDKLLISEFANDDLVFLSRLANNEALYLHRETPPATNTLHRVVLIDATLKNWGNPKTIAFALAIAVARHPKTDIPVAVYVVGNDTHHPVLIDRVESIIDGLQIVKGGLHAGGGLETFFKEQHRDKDREILFITEPTTLHQPGLQRVLTEYQQHIHYHLHIDAAGHIDVYKRQGSTRKHLQHLHLPLDELWKKEAPAPKRTGQPPAQFRLNYPMLLRGDINPAKVLLCADGEIFQLTRAKSILRLYDKNKPKERGWDLVHHKLPFMPTYWEVGRTTAGHHVVLLFNRNTREVVLINLQTGDQRNVFFKQWRSSVHLAHFVFHHDRFIHRTYKDTWSISVDGEIAKLTGDYFDDTQQRAHKLNETGLSLRSCGGLKNFRTVWINTQGQLMFNHHVICITADGRHVILAHDILRNINTLAKRVSRERFVFPDGSAIEINSNCLVMLLSSDRLIPVIYIHLGLHFNTPLATAQEFTGHEYFYKEPGIHRIEPGVFFDKYLKRFINTIVNHGT